MAARPGPSSSEPSGTTDRGEKAGGNLGPGEGLRRIRNRAGVRPGRGRECAGGLCLRQNGSEEKGRSPSEGKSTVPSSGVLTHIRLRRVPHAIFAMFASPAFCSDSLKLSQDILST